MANVNHTARSHALLSASGAERWLNCTPSARFEEKFTEKRSTYADEGTLAHEFANVFLAFAVKAISATTQAQELRKLRKHELYYEAMESEVMVYVDYVLEALAIAKAKTPDAVLKIETQLDFSHIVEQGFGTGDAMIIADGVLDVQDLKFGKGVQVDAERNAQLMLYGLGGLRMFDMLYDIHTVRLTIVQPRLDHVSVFEISVEELTKWAESIVRPAAELAYKGDGEHKPGKWCKFCKAKPTCRALAEENLKLAKFEFRDPVELEKHEIEDILKQLDAFKDWAGAVADYALTKALEGERWKGFKVVEGRSQRSWKDEAEIIKVLTKAGYKKTEVTQTKLKGIGAMETIVGKSDLVNLLGGLIIKPDGKPALVPATDKRPELNSLAKAQAEFGDSDD